MTSNERKIINFLRDAKEKTHIRLIAKKTNFSSDYTRSLCHSLARAGYVKLEDSNICHLLKKGQGHFESVAVMREVSEPVVVTANVTLLIPRPTSIGRDPGPSGLGTDEPTVASPASDRSDVVRQSSPQEEENQEEGASEEKDKDKSASSDEELNKALADLEPSSQKDESEEKDKPEEPQDETENEPEKKTEEIAEGSKEEINTDKKEDALNKEVLAETETTEEEKMERPDETELKPEPKAEEAKETALEAEMKTTADTADDKEEAKAENPGKVALKKEPAQPGGGFGASFKKIVNWFAEKK